MAPGRRAELALFLAHTDLALSVFGLTDLAASHYSSVQRVFSPAKQFEWTLKKKVLALPCLRIRSRDGNLNLATE